tara:strand:- start:1107 stop:1328 length:222 start_codon:yes stop_codon:yes gene_type:complete
MGFFKQFFIHFKVNRLYFVIGNSLIKLLRLGFTSLFLTFKIKLFRHFSNKKSKGLFNYLILFPSLRHQKNEPR